MLLKNLSAKIIGVGTTILMPDGVEGDSVEVSKDIAELPSVKALEKQGYLRIVADKKPSKAKEAPKEEVSAEEGVDTAEEKKPVKKASKKPKEAPAE